MLWILKVPNALDRNKYYVKLHLGPPLHQIVIVGTLNTYNIRSSD